MPRSYRMTPARRNALRKAQAASARKRKGRGKGKPTKARTYKQLRRRQRIKTGAKIAAIGGAYALAHAAKSGGRKRTHKRNRAQRDLHTRAYARDLHAKSQFLKGTAARAHGGGPNRSNRVFVTTKHGTTSVRRKHH